MRQEDREALAGLLAVVLSGLMLAFTAWVVLVEYPRHERDVGRCEGRGGVWIRDHGCVRPLVPLPDTTARSER